MKATSRTTSPSEDLTHVKFYRYSLRAEAEGEGEGVDRFVHIDDWVPPGRPDGDEGR